MSIATHFAGVSFLSDCEIKTPFAISTLTIRPLRFNMFALHVGTVMELHR